MSKMRNFDSFLMEKLHNKAMAEVYLKVALEEFIEDHDQVMFLRALHNVARAQGNGKKLSHPLSKNKSPSLDPVNVNTDTIGSIIKKLGFEMTVCAPTHRDSTCGKHYYKSGENLFPPSCI